jgi:hypothetical protein
VSLLLAAMSVAGGVIVARVLGAMLRTPHSSSSDADPEDEAAATPKPPDDLFARFPCKLGDVLVRRAERDEAWLAGVLVFAEERPVAALFVAPEARQDRAILVREAQPEVTWLLPASGPPGLAGRDPPSVLEHEGVRFDRKRRLPVRVERLGTGAPHVGATAVLAEYTGPGAERFLVVAGAESTLSWRGVALGESDYDLLPG